MTRLLFVLTLLLLQQTSISQKVFIVPKAVEVKKTTVKLNGILNASLGGTGRSVIEVILPPNTKEWYFSFTTWIDKGVEQSAGNAIGLPAYWLRHILQEHLSNFPG